MELPARSGADPAPHPLATPRATAWDPHPAHRPPHSHGPVQQVIAPTGHHISLVTGHDEARRALTDPVLVHDIRRLHRREHGFGGRRCPDDVFAMEGRHLLNSDGAEHQRLRDVLAPLFTRAMTAHQRGVIDDACDAVLTRMAGHDTPELVAHFARPLTVHVTAQLMGIPAEDVAELTALTLAMVSGRNPELNEVRHDRIALTRLWARIIGRRRRAPRQDLLSQLIRAEEHGALSRQELVSTAWGVFSGGITPTTAFLASGAVELMGSPRHQAMLRAPRQTRPLIGELLRLTSPFPFAAWRFALEEVTMGSTRIPQGAPVLISLAAANRDPSAYGSPDALRPEHRHHHPHLAFGHGPHYCPGSHLARLMATVALRSLFRRFPRLRPAVPLSELSRRGSLIDRCYRSVPVHLETRR